VPRRDRGRSDDAWAAAYATRAFGSAVSIWAMPWIRDELDARTLADRGNGSTVSNVRFFYESPAHVGPNSTDIAEGSTSGHTFHK